LETIRGDFIITCRSLHQPTEEVGLSKQYTYSRLTCAIHWVYSCYETRQYWMCQKHIPALDVCFQVCWKEQVCSPPDQSYEWLEIYISWTSQVFTFCLAVAIIDWSSEQSNYQIELALCKGILTSLELQTLSLVISALCTLFFNPSMYFLPAIGPLSLFWTLHTSLCIYVHILVPSSCIISHH
jgi:cytochrome b561